MISQSEIISVLIPIIIFILLTLMASRVLEKRVLLQFVSAYFLGIITVIPMVIGLQLASRYDLISNILSFRRSLFFSFIVVGFLAEFSKFLLLRYHFIRKDVIAKPFDGILYSVMIAMGFSTVANIYFYFYMETPFNLPLVTYSLPFANLIVGIILGFFVGFGKFRKQHVDYLTGLAAAIFFQGFYIFCILADDFLLIGLVGFVMLIISVLLSLRSINTDVRQIM